MATQNNNRNEKSKSKRKRKKAPYKGSVAETVVRSATSAATGALVGKLVTYGLQLALNHPNWYDKYNLQSFTNMNYGARIQRTLVDGQAGLTVTSHPQPFLMQFNYVNSWPHIASADNSGARQAINRLYSMLRAANAGAVNYTPDDLQCYVHNVREAMTLLAFTRRLLSTCFMTNPYINDTPDVYIKANFMDPANSVNNVANTYQFYDNIAMRAEQFNNQISKQCPLTMDALDRAMFLAHNYFLDSDSPKAQTYVFTPAQWMAVAITSSGSYTFLTFPNSAPDDILDAIQMLNQALSTEISNIIAGDMIKAFGSQAYLPKLDWSKAYLPCVVYDEDILHQIQNADIMDITQSSFSTITMNMFTEGLRVIFGTVETQFSIPTNASLPPGAPYYNSTPNELVEWVMNDKEDVSPALSMSYLRLKTALKHTWVTATTGIVSLADGSCNTEIVLSAVVHYPVVNNSSGIGYTSTPFHRLNSMSVSILMQDIRNIARFKYHPILRFYAANATVITEIHPVVDLDNFANPTYDEIDRISDLANVSLFAPKADLEPQGRWQAKF